MRIKYKLELQIPGPYNLKCMKCVFQVFHDSTSTLQIEKKMEVGIFSNF